MTFKKGQSGNPSGRPVGLIDRRVVSRKLLEESAEDLIRETIRLAMSGDKALIKLLIERLVPALKPETTLVSFPNSEKGPGEDALTVINAISQGLISPSVGNEILAGIATTMRLRQEAETAAEMKAQWGTFKTCGGLS
jgi:hypothetical protein